LARVAFDAIRASTDDEESFSYENIRWNAFGVPVRLLEVEAKSFRIDPKEDVCA